METRYVAKKMYNLPDEEENDGDDDKKGGGSDGGSVGS